MDPAYIYICFPDGRSQCILIDWKIKCWECHQGLQTAEYNVSKEGFVTLLVLADLLSAHFKDKCFSEFITCSVVRKILRGIKLLD